MMRDEWGLIRNLQSSLLYYTEREMRDHINSTNVRYLLYASYFIKSSLHLNIRLSKF